MIAFKSLQLYTIFLYFLLSRDSGFPQFQNFPSNAQTEAQYISIRVKNSLYLPNMKISIIYSWTYEFANYLFKSFLSNLNILPPSPLSTNIYIYIYTKAEQQ